jgi:hypothetical protein
MHDEECYSIIPAGGQSTLPLGYVFSLRSVDHVNWLWVQALT